MEDAPEDEIRPEDLVEKNFMDDDDMKPMGPHLDKQA